MADIIKKKISFNIIYNTTGDVDAFPRIDKPDFSAEGLGFHLDTRKTKKGRFLGVYMDLSEACKKTLMPGYQIDVMEVRLEYIGDDIRNTETNGPLCIEDEAVEIIQFSLMKHCDVQLVMKFSNIQPVQFVDATVAKEKLSDCKIVFEDDGNKEVYANKNILAMSSPVFRALFFGDAQGENPDVVKLSNVKQADFLEYLLRVYLSPNQPFVLNKLEALLTLADRFMNDELISSIESFLTGKKGKSKNKQQLLRWADVYNMKKLFSTTFKAMTKKELKALDMKACKEFKKDNIEFLTTYIVGRLSMKVEPNESAASSDDVTEVASLDLDESPTNVFKTKLSINILYDTIDGVKKNPRIDKPGFSLEGLEFQFGISTFDNDRFPYALALELHESSKNRLARGYEISVRYEDVMTFSDEGHIERDESKKDFGMLALTELAFSAAVTRFELVVEMKFEDIFPHRLQYVNAEVAKENMNDCKLILVDDENKVVYVNKHILASRSPFFKTLLFGRGKKKVIKLNGVKLTDFLEYLYCCYPIPIRPFAFKRLEALLGLAGRFQNHALKVEIETYLTEKKGNTSKEKEKILIWADTYDMTALFRNILKTMSEAELKKIASKTYKNFKKENLELLVSCFICHSC